MSTPILTPAYDRNYRSMAKVLKDFNANKDFILNDPTSRYNGKYANKADLMNHYKNVQFRYRKNTMVFVHNI